MQGVQAGRDVYTQVVIYYSEKEQKEVEVLVNIHHLPEPTTALIGRKTELAQLTEAIKNPNKRLAIIVAAGGIGKSALTDEWLQHIAHENYYGKTRVFGWSFYSQGSHNTFTNSQPFFSAVLPFLGITDIPKDEIEKARVLARCLQQQPCLLILDGLEPLQYAENLQAMNGELQDSALKEFIACFRRTPGQSFVLFSSRQPLVELKKWQPEHYLSMDLKTLPHDDGAQLLNKLGVKGKPNELEKISLDLNGHALSLVLMGHLLSEHHQGDCRYANELPPLTSAHGDSDAEKDSRHALRVLDYYDSLQDAASRCFLQLLGLFDRPMNTAEKAVLIAKANHAEPLRALTAKQWQAVEQRLEKSGLLLGKKGSFERLEWDTHPIIRSYFGEKFKECYPEAFKQAHFVLFDYYQKLPEKEFPDTLEEMSPLYQAVKHGCLAEEYQQALENVFQQRIRRKYHDSSKSYSLHKLGSYSQDLIVLSSFFSSNWQSPIQTLDEVQQAWLLQAISFCFASLGRLQNAIEPRKAHLNLATQLAKKQLEEWSTVIVSGYNLIDCYIPLGRLSDAEITAKKMVDDSTKDVSFFEFKSLSYLATILHRSGNFNEARKYFQQAEQLLKPYLTSLSGYQYCSLLLDSFVSDEVTKRVTYSLKKHEGKDSLLTDALDYLTLARINVILNKNAEAKNIFEKAIQSIQKANKVNYEPIFYLYRADFYLTQNQLDGAQADLNSAWEIIERCGMKLYAVDYLALHGRYSLATADFDTALNHYTEAKQLIEETGYHLRDAELDLFAAQLRWQCGEAYRETNLSLYSQPPEYYLQKARLRIEEIGQWGLLRVIERDFPGM